MINKLFREDLKDFKPYVTESDIYKIRLDANESFLNYDTNLEEELVEAVKGSLFNRYPDAEAQKLKELYGKYAKVPSQNIIVGNGSDELIQIISNCFVNGGGKSLSLVPDFSMYGLYTQISGGIPIEYLQKEDFSIEIEDLINTINEEEVKVVFLSNPNNPTGQVIERKDIIKLLENCNSIVVIDEAYYEFYGETVVDLIDKYENLIVLRTASKAIGLAALRLGFLITNEKLVQELKKVKPPFNVNSISQALGEVVLRNTEGIEKNIYSILKEKEFLFNGLKAIQGIKVYPSKANFILIQGDLCKDIKDKAFNSSISIRYYNNGPLKNCLRITAGSREENEAFLKAIRGEA